MDKTQTQIDRIFTELQQQLEQGGDPVELMFAAINQVASITYRRAIVDYSQVLQNLADSFSDDQVGEQTRMLITRAANGVLEEYQEKGAPGIKYRGPGGGGEVSPDSINHDEENNDTPGGRGIIKTIYSLRPRT